ncbi:hypothetical protein [Verrucomicrobium sp. GAS474]|uniref:hypothetical protein n=1 Tax=Verrucomicrobium sp. GAS474 TaxID=1882831 RepID=UPI000B80F37B|nr:hypothetical protein [Verrucomicrobium sp. GAS474]
MSTRLRLSTLTYLGFELNAALEQGHLHSISVEDVQLGLQEGTLISNLQARLEDAVDLSLLLGKDQERPLLEALCEANEAFVGRAERKAGVRFSGLCVLNTLILEVIQRSFGK